MKQGRLNSLAMISIEQEVSRNIDYNQGIDTFAKEKVHQKQFL